MTTSAHRIFASSSTVAAVVTLVLIENSQSILPFWNDLRQHYLPTLLGTLRMANPIVPIPVLWLTTAPVGDDSSSIHTAPPRQYNQLPELKFSFNPDNRITSRIINRATELMLEAANQFPDGPVNFHLFIVAASPPIQGTWGVSMTMPSQIGQSEWRLLGQRMAQLGIHCHMILPTSQDVSSMNELFTTSLQLQAHTQVSPWFLTKPEYTFLLSGNPSGATIPVQEAPTVGLQQPLPVARPPVLRHQSYPQDVQSAVPELPPAPAQNASTPSIVTSLQKVHGLSRKKLYGTQPPRQPFVREEPVRTKYKSSPTPLSIPVGSQPFPATEDTRTVGKAKIERGRRPDRPSHIVDASNSTSPGRRSPWNHVSSDVGSSPSSPSPSLSSHHTTSPTIPLYPDLAGYTTSPPTTSAGFSPSIASPPISETNFSTSLHDPSGSYFSMTPPFQSPPMPVTSQAPTWTSMPKSSVPMAKSSGMATSARRHSQELAHGPHTQSLSAMSSKYRLDSVGSASEARPNPTKNSHKVKDAGDVPFIFSPELEAVTAAKLKAALQCTTSPPVSSPPLLSSSAAVTTTLNAFPGFTSGNPLNYAVAEGAYTSSQPLLAAPPPMVPPRSSLSLGYDYGMRTEDAIMTRPHLTTGLVGFSTNELRDVLVEPVDSSLLSAPAPPFALGTTTTSTSSSLQGWAG